MRSRRLIRHQRVVILALVLFAVIQTWHYSSETAKLNARVFELKQSVISVSRISERTEVNLNMSKETYKTLDTIIEYIAENNCSWSFDQRYDIAQKIVEEAMSNGIDPLLVAGTIKVESHFNNSSLSVASAKGMMQLIPSTAKSMARELGMTSYDLSDYNDNIELGCYYLARSIDAYELGSVSRSHPRTGVKLSDQDMGVLAYNGGVIYASTLRNIEYLDRVSKEYNLLKSRIN